MSKSFKKRVAQAMILACLSMQLEGNFIFANEIRKTESTEKVHLDKTDYEINKDLKEEAIYVQNFDDITLEELGWETIEGSTVKTQLVDGQLQLKTQPVSSIIDMKAPDIADGELSLDFKIVEGDGRFSFGFRTKSKSSRATIGYDSSGNWVWSNCNGKSGTMFNYPIENNKTYNLKIRYIGSSITVHIDDQKMYEGEIPDLPVEAGKIGVRAWYAPKTMVIDNITLKPLKNANKQPERPADAQSIQISNGEMTLTVEDTFPLITQYRIDEQPIFTGQMGYNTGIKINGKTRYADPEKVSVEVKDNKVNYIIPIEDENEGLGLKIHCTIAIKENNIITFDVTRIEEISGEKVNTIGFDQSLITLNQGEDAYAAIVGGNKSDEYGSVAAINHTSKKSISLSHAFPFTKHYAASIETNTMRPKDKITLVENGIEKTLEFKAGTYTYRAMTEEEIKSSGLPETEALPSVQIKIIGDANEDGAIDWQDGAIGYREIMPSAVGEERIRDSIAWIALNQASNAASPFLRVLDTGKMYSQYIDGFGQRVMNKGYQGEGHDDSHPDYDYIGIRQGGVEEFNILVNAAKAYNIDSGIHINATEYMLDAMDTKLETLQGGELGKLNVNWINIDNSYLVDQRKDVTSGELQRRLEDLEVAVPELDFIYVDVYYVTEWYTKKFANMMKDMGCYIATEFPQAFQEDQIWTHWGTDMYYPATDSASYIYRFIHNHHKDMYNPHPLLKGLQMPALSNWIGKSDLKEGVDVFYNQNLPTKYMQYFEIMKSTEDRIDFKDGAYVEKDGERVKLYSKDRNLIADMSSEPKICKTNLFIPWNPIEEDKIYHWNNDGGKTTWQLPKSWSEVESVHVFKLDSQGRQYMEEISVENGQVTLQAEKQTPYIVTKTKDQDNGLPKETEWGEGSIIKDPGFNGKNLNDQWSVSTTAPTKDHVQIITDSKYDHKVEIKGTDETILQQDQLQFEPGKNYNLSVWVDTQRPVVFGVQIGGENYEVEIDNNKYLQTRRNHKYSNTKFQQLSLDVQIPETFDVSEMTARVYVKVLETEQEVNTTIDDFRIVELNEITDRSKEEIVYYEDFENIAEGWGPFVYPRVLGGRTHLAYKDPEGSQIKDYVIDGKWSLKTQDLDKGEILVTRPFTVEFKSDKTYQVSFDYQLSKESKGETIAANPNTNYLFSAKDGEGNVLATTTLEGSEIISQVEANTKQAMLEFSTEHAKEVYVTIEKTHADANTENMLIIDNFMVKEKREALKSNLTINGAESVAQGEILKLEVGTTGIDKKIYAQDFTIAYDKQMFELINVENIDSKTEVYYQEVEEGARVLLATEGGLPNNTESVVVSLKAKQTEEVQEIEQTIRIKDIQLGAVENALSEIILSGEAKKDVTIKPKNEESINKEELYLLIEKAKELVVNAEAGNNEGQYPEEAINTLQKAIEKAELVAQNSKDQTEIDQAAETLNSAIKVFESEKVAFKDPDVNQDGNLDIADLALIAYYYHVESPEAQKADINHDKVIDIYDLTIVANKILFGK